MKNRIYAIIYFILGVLTAAAPYTFAKVCGVMGGCTPACRYTAKAEIGAAGVLIVLAVILFFTENRDRAQGLHISSGLQGLLILLLPVALTGVCPDAHMHCHSVTRPVLVIFGAAVIIAAAVALFTERSRDKDKEEEQDS